MQNHTAQDFMTKNVISVDRYARFSDIQKILHNHDIHHLPVTEEQNHLIGMVSMTDILKTCLTHTTFTTLDELDKVVSVNTIMHTQPQTITPDTPLLEAAKLIHACPFNYLPVVKGKDILVGILTTKDLIKSMLV